MIEPTWQRTGVPARADVTGVLLVPEAAGRPRAVTVDRQVVIGREDTCDVVLVSEMVSRRHARLWPDDGRFAVEDLDSRNGTRLNGRPITSPSEIHDGDRLTFGDVDVQFRLFAPGGFPSLPRQTVSAGPRAHQGPTQPLASSQQAATGSGATKERPVEAKPLVLAVLESLVGAAFSQAFGTGIVGAFVLAAITPLIGTAFALRKDGRIRKGPVVLVTAIAVALTVTGVTAAELKLGRSVFPFGDSERTFVPVPDEGTPDAPKRTMPKLAGYDNVSAMQLLERAGFDDRNVLLLRVASSTDDFGKVVRTDPAAGRSVPNNAIVKVYLGDGSSGTTGSQPPGVSPSATAKILVVPDIRGYSNVAYMTVLERAGFDFRNVLTNTESAPDLFGKVVRTDPPAGSKVSSTDLITVYIGVG